METKMSLYGNEWHRDIVPNQEQGETMIVCPASAGASCLDELRELFKNAAGGYTETTGLGGWRADGGELEPVHIFTITGLPMGAVKRAAEFILEAGQTAVYVKLASGQCCWFNSADVEFKPIF